MKKPFKPRQRDAGKPAAGGENSRKPFGKFRRDDSPRPFKPRRDADDVSAEKPPRPRFSRDSDARGEGRSERDGKPSGAKRYGQSSPGAEPKKDFGRKSGGKTWSRGGAPSDSDRPRRKPVGSRTDDARGFGKHRRNDSEDRDAFRKRRMARRDELPRAVRHVPQAIQPETPPESASGGMRIQRYLALAGQGARRECEQFILDGRVRVNGVTVTKLGATVVPGVDTVELDRAPIDAPTTEDRVYFMFHKPEGCITSVSDPEGRPTIFDRMPKLNARVVPVGRLDFESEGLLLLTNDGELAYRLMHPKFEVEKEYHVKAQGRLSEEAVEELRSGVKLYDGTRCQPARVRVVKRTEGSTELMITIREGRKRQIREMLRAVGHNTRRLIRLREGSLTLGDMGVGRLRPLTDKEIDTLRSEVGLPSARVPAGKPRHAKPEILDETEDDGDDELAAEDSEAVFVNDDPDAKDIETITDEEIAEMLRELEEYEKEHGVSLLDEDDEEDFEEEEDDEDLEDEDEEGFADVGDDDWEDDEDSVEVPAAKVVAVAPSGPKSSYNPLADDSDDDEEALAALVAEHAGDGDEDADDAEEDETAPESDGDRAPQVARKYGPKGNFKSELQKRLKDRDLPGKKPLRKRVPESELQRRSTERGPRGGEGKRPDRFGDRKPVGGGYRDKKPYARTSDTHDGEERAPRGDRPKSFGDRKFTPRKPGAGGYGERPYRDKPYGTRKPFLKKDNGEDGAAPRDSAAGARRFGARKFDGGKERDGDTRGRKPFEKKPFGRKPFDGKPYGRKPFAKDFAPGVRRDDEATTDKPRRIGRFEKVEGAESADSRGPRGPRKFGGGKPGGARGAKLGGGGGGGRFDSRDGGGRPGGRKPPRRKP